MPVLDQDLGYDFNFQDIRSIGPRKIMPVSKIHTQLFSTLWKLEPVKTSDASMDCENLAR